MSDKPEIIQSGNLFDSTTKWRDLASQKPKYKSALFAYLDILAYKALVELFGDAAPQQIVTILSEVIPFPESSYKTISVRVISDSILVMSEDTSMVSLVNLINVVEMLRMGLLKYRLMVRGAIVRDRHFDAGNIIVSPALISGYLAESQEAIYPRVLIADGLVSDLSSASVQMNSIEREIPHQTISRVYENDIIARDFDGKYIIKFKIAHDEMYLVRYRGAGFLGRVLTDSQWATVLHNCEVALTAYRKEIMLLVGQARNSKDKMKVDYLINTFNAFLRDLENERMNGQLIV